MNTDFYDAHQRHWDDAELLYEKQRWANADHLYGMAAECGLKQLMLAFGMTFDSGKDRPVDIKDRAHANDVWARYESYRGGHHRGAAYALTSSNPFDDWRVAQRYAHQSQFDTNRANKHRDGAENVRQLVRKAALEGLWR
ncbi:MAG TPA: SAM-dependent methyltransferase [Accumulibacter sp.]|jgi:hypothetical protein|nr:SAM-dependent methyltransferase [Accumulibacter sp.]